MPITPERKQRNAQARLSLEGLSIGDAFGQQFFHGPELLATRELPAPQWYYTDDTVMAMNIFDVLEFEEEIKQDELARRFAESYDQDPHRGYGGTAHGILRNIADGQPWREAAGKVFDGTGSMGNGAAMRVGPIGGYFADDLGKVVEQARLSAEITHMHPDGQAGAIAIAVAAAIALNTRDDDNVDPMILFDAALDHTDDGPTRRGIEEARQTPLNFDVRTAAQKLGSGDRIISSDTVPFCLWAASKSLRDTFEETMWMTVTGLGDRDTTCAIVGSIVALALGQENIPRLWIDHREPLVV